MRIASDDCITLRARGVEPGNAGEALVAREHHRDDVLDDADAVRTIREFQMNSGLRPIPLETGAHDM